MIFSFQITDAVVVAWILNATLVVPELDHHSFWKDDRWFKNLRLHGIFYGCLLLTGTCPHTVYVICSEFSDIFDTDWFISYLSKDVTVVKRIPYEVMISMDKLPWTMRAPRKSMPEFYIDEVLPILMRRRVSKPNKRICLGLVAYYSVFIECMLLFIASILVKHVIMYRQKLFHFAVFLLITLFNFKI